MTRPAVADSTSTSAPVEPMRGKIEVAEPRNLAVLACYQILLRVGWIFKTESVIVPAVLDVLAPAGWLRGLLPVLNRIGQGFAPLAFAGYLGRLPRKRGAVAVCTLLMAASWGAFAALWWSFGMGAGWLAAAAFLALYGAFHTANGLALVASRTLQGKLIRPARRGRLLALSTSIGAVAAIGFAVWLLPGWLERGPAGFVPIFTFTSACFVAGALSLMAVSEPPDAAPASSRDVLGPFAEALRTWRTDVNFRRLATIAMLFGTVLILFPHYQALARERLGLGLGNLMWWVVVQNAGTGLFGLLAGPAADRAGTRLVLRVLLAAVAVSPLAAVGLGYVASPDLGRRWFWLVFVLIGFTPVTMKMLSNYALEASPAVEHPRYLGALSLAAALPFAFSPLVGWLVDAAGFAPIFLFAALLILTASLLTFTITEPRAGPRDPSFTELDSLDDPS